MEAENTGRLLTDLNISFQCVSAYFRLQFQRALRWGVAPGAGPVKCVTGQVCSNFLRVEAALQGQTQLTTDDFVSVGIPVESPALIQEILREIVRTVPLLRSEADWVRRTWEQMRRDRAGKGGDLVVHGLLDGVVSLVEQGKLSGDGVLHFSRFLPLRIQQELLSLLVPEPPAEGADERGDWRLVWRAIAAGNHTEAMRLRRQQQWSERHYRRVLRASTQLGSLAKRQLSQRQLLALAAWPDGALAALRAQGTITVDGKDATTQDVEAWSEEEIKRIGLRLVERIVRT